MPANFKSNKSDTWRINTSDLTVGNSELLKKQREQPQQILDKENVSNISSLLVVPSDYNDLPAITNSLYVGKKGYLSFLNELDQIKTILIKKDSSLFSIKTKRVLFTNTTASSIIALF